MWAASADATVTLNGFPLFLKDDSSPTEKNSKCLSLIATPYLRDGTNVIAYSYDPVVPDDVQVSVEGGEGFTMKEQGPGLSIDILSRTLSARSYEPIALSSELVQAGTLVTGTYDTYTGQGTFVKVAGTYVWEFAWPAASEDFPIYDYIPYEFIYELGGEVAELTIAFLNADDSHEVVYDVTPEITGSIDISALTPSSGAQHVEDAGFCKVRLSYDDPDEAHSVSFVLQGTEVSHVTGFPIVFPAPPFPINSTTMQGGTSVDGDFVDGMIVSEDIEGTYAWKYEFSTGNSFHYVPSSLNMYVVESAENQQITVTFSDGDAISEVYSDLELGTEGHTVDLYAEEASPGTHLDDTVFSSIEIESSAPFRLKLVLEFDMRSAAGVTECEVSVSHTWAWESAQTVTDASLSQSDKEAITAQLIQLDQEGVPIGGLWYEMNTENVSAVIDRLEHRINDISAAAGISSEDGEDSLSVELEGVFAMTIVNEVMEDMDSNSDGEVLDNLVFTVLRLDPSDPDGKVVHVTHDTLDHPIMTKTFEWGEETFPGLDDLSDEYAIEVFFSKVDTGGQTYEWRIVR